ncbi:MAG: autotransporter-associated beta strand repeat-containing protein [Methylacidiphilales bacterium]|nr:autotransporter-associated beta strand repeat-containing protein [Candidatus Methylacidiphilales bacterium]
MTGMDSATSTPDEKSLVSCISLSISHPFHPSLPSFSQSPNMDRRWRKWQLGVPSNWSTNTVPSPGANVTFSGTIQTTVDLQVNRIVGTLTFDSSADAFTLNSYTLIPSAINNNSSQPQTINSTIELTGNRTFTAASAPLIYNTIHLSDSAVNRTLTMAGASNHLVTGSITNGLSTASNLTKTGSGTLTLSGNSPNTYTGLTTVASGTLELNKTPGVNAINGNLLVQSSGTLLLSQSDQINNTSNLTLAGGTFSTQGFSETLGVLTLSASSTLDLGSGNSILQFANSSSAFWNSSAQLQILNWSGSTNGGGTDQIYFGTNSSGLTPTKLAQIVFVNPQGLAPGI